MAKCPKCGADMVNDGDNLKCPNCNSTQIKESANAGQEKNGDAQQSELELLKARLAELEKKQEKNDKVKTGSLSVKEKLATVAVFFKKWGLKAVLPAALFLIAFITLLVCFCGLRGIYVNVNNPNEFYSFSPTSYEYHGNLLGEEYVDEGTWTTSGGELKLTYRDEMFGKITDSYSFSHTGYGTVYITDSLGAKKQFKRVSILAYSTPQNIKVAVSLNGGTGSGGGENKLSIGSKIKEPSEPTREGFQFMGWYTTADGWKTEGASQFNFNSRIWEDTTVYTNWKDLTEYKLTGDMLPEEGVTFFEGDDLTQIYQSAGGVNEKIGNGSVVLEFKDENGKIVSGAAPRSNVTATLKEVVIGNNVSSIPVNAFKGCTSLTSVTIGDSVTSIGSNAFDGCRAEINWSSNPTIETISSNAFSGYKGTSITIPDGVTSIGDYAFSSCGSLTSVTVPDSVTSIGSYAFYKCTSLTSVTLPNSVTSIGDSAFYDCSSLTSVNIPYSVMNIGNKAFYNSKNTTTIYIGLPSRPSGWNLFWYGSGIKIVYDKTVTSSSNNNFNYYVLNDGIYITKYIGSNTVVEIPEYIDGKKVVGLGIIFESNTTVSSVTISDGIKAIPYRMFYGCTSLTSVTIPDSVTSIGDYAFYGCSSLTSVTVPDSVTSIGSYAFYECTSLTSITIPDGVTSIGSYAFSGCTSLTSVIIGDSVTSIGKNLFEDCASLTSVTIPDSVTSIGDWAFRNCTSLTSVTIGDSVTSIGEYAFYSCYSLSSATIGNSVTCIGDYTFGDCPSLTSVTIPDSVTSIGEYAFSDCDSLTIYCEAASEPSGWDYYWNDSNCPVVWDANNSDVADDGYIYYTDENGLRYALNGTTAEVVRQARNLRGNIEIPASISFKGIIYSVMFIEFRAFYNCTSLTSVTIPDSVMAIRSDAFENCTSLTSVTIPDSVMGIGSGAFSGCTSLTSVTIPGSETSIGSDTFYNCTSLTYVIIPDSVTSIGFSAFENCTSLTSVIFEGTVAQWHAIWKNSSWNDNTPYIKVVCSDGTLYV